MRQKLKRTPLYPAYRFIRRCLKRLWCSWRTEHRVEIESVVTRFQVNDAYSCHWFYPRSAGGRLYEESVTVRFLQEARSTRVIADVGANLGWFTCLAANINPRATVFSFEMDHANCEICRRNIALNGLSNVVLEHAAVTCEPGMIKYRTPSRRAASAIHRLGNTNGTSCEVKAITLDEYFRDQACPSLMKIDVEGAEQRVLEGMQSILSSGTLETIFIEIHPKWLKNLSGSISEVIGILRGSGYALNCLRHRVSHSSEEPIEISDIESVSSADRMLVARRSPRNEADI